MSDKQDGGHVDSKSTKGLKVGLKQACVAIATITLVCMAYSWVMHDGPTPGDKTPV